ncbi:hypothetical protein AGMMS49992_13260 [Clostridia bacterium]|nr:hypothetical protein AGMMS49992_13260 [Clostridia bacterium]
MNALALYGEIDMPIHNYHGFSRQFDRAEPSKYKAWMATDMHYFTSAQACAITLDESLRRLRPDWTIEARDFERMMKYYSPDEYNQKKAQESEADANLMVIGKALPHGTIPSLERYARPDRTVLVMVDSFLVEYVQKYPWLLDKLNEYAAIFEQSVTGVSILQNLGLTNSRVLYPYRIWSDADLRRVKPRQNLKRLVWYGNYYNAKVCESTIQAVRSYNANHPDAPLRFDIYGPPNTTTEAQLSAVIADDPNIRMMGTLDGNHAVATLAQYDAMLRPSLENNQSLLTVLLTAIAAGLPIITTNHNYHGELVIDGRNGFLVPFGDQYAIESCLEQLTNDPELLRSMSARNIALFKALYSEKSTTRELLTTIDRLMAY